jgi:predicted dehydrogenase
MLSGDHGMRVAVIGAGRNRNGIGEFIAGYFQKSDTSVVSVLGTTEQSARKASHSLKRYGIEAAVHTDFAEMVRKVAPDAVIIASPVATHYDYLMKCMEAGVHVFCEKPFILQETGELGDLLDEIFEMAAKKNLTIAMNAQWPFSLPYYEKLCGPIKRQEENSFHIALSPVAGGREMVLDSLPHALSLLQRVLGIGEIRSLQTELSEEKADLRFQYVTTDATCSVTVKLVKTEHQPRNFQFGFNDRVVSRIIDMQTYSISFTYLEKTVNITDPLELSVKDFIAAVNDVREPLIGKDHIINTTTLLNRIMAAVH